MFASRMVECVTVPDSGVRQSACYGIGVMSLHGNAAFLPFLRDALPLLVNVLNDPDSPRDSAMDNALSAYVKISRYRARATIPAAIS